MSPSSLFLLLLLSAPALADGDPTPPAPSSDPSADTDNDDAPQEAEPQQVAADDDTGSEPTPAEPEVDAPSEEPSDPVTAPPPASSPPATPERSVPAEAEPAIQSAEAASEPPPDVLGDAPDELGDTSDDDASFIDYFDDFEDVDLNEELIAPEEEPKLEGLESLIEDAVREALERIEESKTTRKLRLAYSGGHAFGHARYDFSLVERIRRVMGRLGTPPESTQVMHGVLSQGPWMVWADDRTVGGVFRSLDGTVPECVSEGVFSLLRTRTEWVILPDHPSVKLLERLRGITLSEIERFRCTTQTGTLIAAAPPGSVPPDWDPLAFDTRHALALRFTADDGPIELFDVGLPREEASRRFRRIRDLLNADPDLRYIDAGDFIDGVSTLRAGAMSVHRATGFRALQRLQPLVLVPGAGELSPGPGTFLDEAAAYGLHYIAANWRTDDIALKLPPSHRLHLDTDDGPIDVMFIGIIDPEVGRRNPALAAEGVEIIDPTEALLDLLDELEFSDDPWPDAIFLVTNASAAEQDALKRRLRGVDVVIGDGAGAGLRLEQMTAQLRRVPVAGLSHPLTLPMAGAAVATFSFADDGHLESALVEPQLVGPEDPPDRDITAAITKARSVVYPGVDRVLIAEDPNRIMQRVPQSTIQRIVCEAMLKATGADVAFLAELPKGLDTPGPLTDLLVAQRLAVLDHLELHKVDGDRLVDFLQQAHGEVPIVCGAPTGTRAVSIRGRPVDPIRTYRVITTDRTVATTRLGGLLDAAASALVGDRPKSRRLQANTASYLTLHEAVLQEMESARATAESNRQWNDRWLARDPTVRRPSWTLQLRRVSFRVNRFSAPDDPAYSQIPESLLNNPSSFTLGADADVGIEYLAPDVSWDLRLRATYARIQIQQNPGRDTADDIILSSALELPLAAFPTKTAFQLQPFGELLYDSEFNPLEDDQGNLLPRQSDLFVTAGLSTRWRWIRILRAGTFLNQDLARVGTNPVLFGGRIEGETINDFLPSASVRLTTRFDLRAWAATPADDATGLRLRLFGEARLATRLFRWMDLGLFLQGLAAQGRIPANNRVVGSWTLGFSFDVSRAISLDRPMKLRPPRRSHDETGGVRERTLSR